MTESLISSVVWRGGELPLMELATLWRTGRGYALRGSVVGALDGTLLATRYSVYCTAEWRTRAVWVELTRPPETQEIRVQVDARGTWTVNGLERPELNGLTDVDIQVTPSTNTLPIQRLAMGVGQEAEVTAAWIQLPSLTVSPVRQSYRRTGPKSYEYRAGNFTAELTIGADGLVETYGSFWRRLQL